MGMAPRPSSGGMAGKIVVSSPVEYYAAMEKSWVLPGAEMGEFHRHNMRPQGRPRDYCDILPGFICHGPVPDMQLNPENIMLSERRY